MRWPSPRNVSSFGGRKPAKTSSGQPVAVVGSTMRRYHSTVPVSSSSVSCVRTSVFVPFIAASLVPLRLPERPRSIWLLNATSPISNVDQSRYSLRGFVTRTSCAAAVASARFSK